MTPATYTAGQIAALLQISRRQFYARLPDLRAAGFPARLPGLGARWSRAQVDAWLATGGAGQGAAPRDGTPAANVFHALP